MNLRTVILFMFWAQLFIGCCDTNTYEVTISGLESRALIFDGNNPVVIDEQSPIDKEDLVIELLITEFESIAYSQQTKTGVRVLKAAVVPCGDDEFIYLNKIDNIKVEMLNSDNEKIDITNQLVVIGTSESISEYIPENSPGTRDFLMRFSNTNNIPNRIDYLIEATLDDGSKISSIGGTINFNE